MSFIPISHHQSEGGCKKTVLHSSSSVLAAGNLGLMTESLESIIPSFLSVIETPEFRLKCSPAAS